MTTPLSGTFLLEDCETIASGIRNGDWLEGGMGAFGAVADGVAMAVDPLGSVLAMGFGWLIDHMEPIKGWFNDLTGDAGEVAAFAATWDNIASHLQGVSDELTRTLADLDDQHGQFFDTYRRFQGESAAHAAAAGALASAMGVGMNIASTIVKIVHDLTRDALTQLAGTAISAATTAAATLGFGTPWAVAQVATRVSALSARVGKSLPKLIKAIKELLPRLDDAARLFRSLRTALDNALAAGGNTLRTATRKADDVSDALPAPHFPANPPRPIADGDIVDMTPYTGLMKPPSTVNGPASFTSDSLRTEPGTAVFWSGRATGPTGAEMGSGGIASGFAGDSGRVSLEMKLNESGSSLPDYDPLDPVSIQAWEDASRGFAEGASGDVVVVLGDTVRPSSIWNTQELPQLTSNPAVSSITAIHPVTGVSTRIWP